MNVIAKQAAVDKTDTGRIIPYFTGINTTSDPQHIDLKPGEEVEFRRTIKDEHQDSPVKTGEYIDLVEAIRLVAERLPGNVSIEIRINNK